MSDYYDGYRDALKMANSLVASATDLRTAHRELRHLLWIWDNPAKRLSGGGSEEPEQHGAVELKR